MLGAAHIFQTRAVHPLYLDCKMVKFLIRLNISGSPRQRGQLPHLDGDGQVQLREPWYKSRAVEEASASHALRPTSIRGDPFLRFLDQLLDTQGVL